MFDPFGDFSTAGYLRNHLKEKDLNLVKQAEHQLFRAQLPTALKHLERCKRIDYADFLRVHEILFSGLYPWAGQDRKQLTPDKAVSKAGILFCHPADCERAVSRGLLLAQDQQQIASRPGHIMGLFAYGHPFLDGNGRTMLVIHAELCFRAGISIDWFRTDKTAYLSALSREIEDPNGSHLDDYLRPFMGPQIKRDTWKNTIHALPGLDGAMFETDTSTSYSDPTVLESHKNFELRRNYRL